MGGLGLWRLKRQGGNTNSFCSTSIYLAGSFTSRKGFVNSLADTVRGEAQQSILEREKSPGHMWRSQKWTGWIVLCQIIFGVLIVVGYNNQWLYYIYTYNQWSSILLTQYPYTASFGPSGGTCPDTGLAFPAWWFTVTLPTSPLWIENIFVYPYGCSFMLIDIQVNILD